MSHANRVLLGELQGADSLEEVSAPVSENMAVGAAVAGIAGNPVFRAQFNIRMTNVYYDETGAAVILAAALPAALQVANPVFVFGNSDYAGNYVKGSQVVPFVNGGDGFWNFVELGIVGRTTFATGAAQYPTAVDGDMIFISQGTVAANVYTRIAIVHCPQVAYGTLLDSISSDRFQINMIRMVVDPTLTDQLTNQITMIRQTLFGKAADDTLDPQSYITGGTFNRNIADIPIEIGVDKNLILGLQMLFNVPLINWTLTVFTVNKLKAAL